MLASKKLKSGKIRGPYGPACDICNRRRVKCDGDPGTVCPRCQNSGRGALCSWNGYNGRQKRGDLLVDSRKNSNSEAFRVLLLEYFKYSNYLESELDGYIQRHSFKDATDFRAHRPKDPDDLMGLSLSLEDFHLDDTQDDDEYADETESPTNIHLWPDKLALVYYGPCSPFRFRSDPLPVASRFPAISENPEATYVLQVIGDGKGCRPNLDWNRYLPSAVPLDRMSHDKALDLFFKFCTPFGLRLIPDLFLKDMNQALIVPRSKEVPKTSHYSPMLHNVLVASALAFLDDPRLQNLETRRQFIDAAKNFMEPECQKPTIAVVQALSLLGNFYGSQGEQGLGFIAFGQSVRVAQALGLQLDCSELVKRFLMDKSDQIDRNYVTWSTFIIDMCWSLYVGREFAVVVPPDDFPLPYIDAALDEMPVVYGNLPPQPNHLTKTFQANAELFIIGRDILEVNNALSKAKARSSLIFDRVGDIGTKLQTWYTSLPPDLQLPVTKYRSTTLVPHRLTLHLCYWWLVVLLHRPFFHHGASIKAGRQIDHAKLCKRASDHIMEMLKMWQEFFGLRFCPVTIIQIAFSAGSVYLLLAMRACSGVRIAKKELNHALDQQHLVTRHLQEIGRSWAAANKVADILKNLVQQRLKPRLDAIPVRSEKSDGHKGDDCSMDAQSPGVPGSLRRRRRSSSSKTRSPVNRRSTSRVSTKDLGSPNPPSGSLNAPISIPTAPIAISPTAYDSKFNTEPLYTGSNATHIPSSSDVANNTLFYNNTSTPNQFFNYDSSYEGRSGQTNFPIPSSSWPLHPNTEFLGVPEGQPILELPFWDQFGMEDAQPSPAFVSMLDEYLHASGDPVASQSELNYAASTEDMDVSADERDYWFGRLGS